MAFKVVERVHVAVHTQESPGDGEWAQYLDHVGHHLDRIDGIFVWSEGGGPTAAQRDQSSKFWAAISPRPSIAVMTPSRFVRALASALSWTMGSQIRAFCEDDFDATFAYLHLGAGQRIAVLSAMDDLRRSLGRPAPVRRRGA